jgi:group I intron endonuclease
MPSPSNHPSIQLIWSEWHPLSKWDKLPRSSGIYEISNKKRGKSYIGSAVDLRRRGHYKSLKFAKSHNKRLQNDFFEDGEQNFVFRVLEFCDQEETIRLEQSHIDGRDFSNLYNVAPIAGSTLGYQFTNEQTEEIRKNRRGVPWSIEAKQSSWIKRIEREWKSKRYLELLRFHKKSDLYDTLKDQLLGFIGDQVNPSLVYKKLRFNEISNWWMFMNGRLVIQERFGFLDHEWSFVSKTSEELNQLRFEKLHCINNTKQFIEMILENIFNHKIRGQIEEEFEVAVRDKKVNLGYKPFKFDYSFIGENSEFSRGITKFRDGSIESFSRSTGLVIKTQEWYHNGNPRIGLIQNIEQKTNEKRVWYESGNPQCLVSFLNGKLHGSVKKWSEGGLLTYHALYEEGDLKQEIEVPFNEEESQLEVVLKKPAQTESAGVSVTIGF